MEDTTMKTEAYEIEISATDPIYWDNLDDDRRGPLTRRAVLCWWHGGWRFNYYLDDGVEHVVALDCHDEATLDGLAAAVLAELGGYGMTVAVLDRLHCLTAWIRTRDGRASWRIEGADPSGGNPGGWDDAV